MVSTKSSTPRRRIGRGVWIAAALAVLIGVLVFFQVRNAATFHWSDFFSTFVKVNWLWLSGAIPLLLLTYLGRALRWEVMLRPLKPQPNLWNVTTATVIGFTALVLLGRAGEVVRPYLIAVKERISFSSQMVAWLLERILDLLLVLLIFGIALARVPPDPHRDAALEWILHTGGYFIASIGALCLLLLVVFRNFGAAAERRILSAITFLPEKFYGRIEKILKDIAAGMECTRDRRFLGLLVFYTVVEWALIVGGHYCIFRALPATAPFGLNGVMIFIGFVAFGSVVQLPGVGGGVQAASVLVLTAIFHIKAGEAWGLAMLIWLLSWVLVVPFGLVLAHHEHISWKKISHITADVETAP